MTPGSIAHTTRLANDIGKPGGIACAYKWSCTKAHFEWQLFRQGSLVGSAGKPELLIAKVERLVAEGSP